jgi:hypothetical protein
MLSPRDMGEADDLLEIADASRSIIRHGVFVR